MAQVPYAHVEAPRALSVDGVRAFNAGDPVPLDTARRLGLLDSEDSPPVLPPYGEVPAGFVDDEIRVSPVGEAPAGDDTTATAEDTTADATPPPAAGDAGTKATPPQAPAKVPKQGPPAVPPNHLRAEEP